MLFVPLNYALALINIKHDYNLNNSWTVDSKVMFIHECYDFLLNQVRVSCFFFSELFLVDFCYDPHSFLRIKWPIQTLVKLYHVLVWSNATFWTAITQVSQKHGRATCMWNIVVVSGLSCRRCLSKKHLCAEIETGCSQMWVASDVQWVAIKKKKKTMTRDKLAMWQDAPDS